MTSTLTRPAVVRAGLVDYLDAWQMQRELHEAVVSGQSPDTVLLLEHPSVYTAGKRTEPWDRPTDGSRVIDVDRGGKITWHGPGQIVGYPIMRLPGLPTAATARPGAATVPGATTVPGQPDPGTAGAVGDAATVPARQSVDVVAYVRRVEQLLIDSCAELGLTTTRVEGRSGVWVPEDDRGPTRKVGAIGIRVARGVAMHGFSLNCDCDLSAYDRIVACGIRDAGVTSLSAELGRQVTVAEVLSIIESRLSTLYP